MKKKTGLCAALLLVLWCPSILLAQNQNDLDLLKKADGLVSYLGTDFSAEYTFVQDKPGQGRTITTAAVFRRDSREMYLIVVNEPAISKGQGYLKQGDTLWFWDPASRKTNTTSSKDRFQNTNARNSDFTRSTLAEDYRITSARDETLGSFKCRVLDLEAKTTQVTYPKMNIWISADGLVRQTKDYSLSGQLLRTSAFPDYYQVGSRFVPKRILFIEELKGATVNGKFENERTQVTINKPSFAKQNDSLFSKIYLESLGK